jgi:hypothetical protein
MKAYWVSGGIPHSFFYLGTGWRWVVSFTPRPPYPQGRSLLNRRLGGPQSPSGRGGEEKNSHGGRTHWTDSQNSDTTAPGGRELYHLQFSLHAASPETSGYTLVFCCCSYVKKYSRESVQNTYSVGSFWTHFCSFCDVRALGEFECLWLDNSGWKTYGPCVTYVAAKFSDRSRDQWRVWLCQNVNFSFDFLYIYICSCPIQRTLCFVVHVYWRRLHQLQISVHWCRSRNFFLFIFSVPILVLKR